MKNILQYALLLLTISVVFVACVKQDFDAPPAFQDCEVESNTTIAQLKQLFQVGGSVLIEDDLIIEGVVVADDRSGNYFRSLIMQDETAGIEVRFNATDLYNDFPIGRRIYIRCKGLSVTDFNGLIQLGTIESALVRQTVCRGPRNQPITPLDITIEELNNTHMSTLIRLTNVQFVNASSGVPFANAAGLQSINHFLESCDTDGQIILRSSGYADFANELTPTGSGTITAIYSVFRDDQQLFIRNPSDVQFNQDRCGGGGTGGVVDSINENFNSGTANQDVNLAGWRNVAVKGTRLWRFQEFNSNIYAQATAFNDTNPEMEAWLITPPINLNVAQTLNFESATSFYVHDGLSVWISTDFNGINVGTATWTQLSANLANGFSGNNNWVASGNIDLSAYSGTGYIGFRHIGNPNNGTSSYRIDNVVVQ
jgi:hypothetical protein